jgi:hypothetical protein
MSGTEDGWEEFSRIAGIVAIEAAGLLGLAGAGLLVITSLGVWDDEGVSWLYLSFSSASAGIYLAVILVGPGVWRSPRRLRLLALFLGGVFVTMLLSGGAGGFILYAPPAVLLLFAMAIALLAPAMHAAR